MLIQNNFVYPVAFCANKVMMVLAADFVVSILVGQLDFFNDAAIKQKTKFAVNCGAISFDFIQSKPFENLRRSYQAILIGYNFDNSFRENGTALFNR